MVGETGFEPATPWSRSAPNGFAGRCRIMQGPAITGRDGAAAGTRFAWNWQLSPAFPAPAMQPSTLPSPPLRVVPAPLLTVKEVAARLKSSRATIYRLCEIGQLRHVRISTHAIRITADDLADFIAGTGPTAT